MPKWTLLITLRKAAGLSQQELADRLGITRSRLGNYEQGLREPDFELVNKIANFFGVTVDALTGRTTEPPPDSEISSEWRQCVAEARALGYTPEQVLQALQLLKSLQQQTGKDR